MGTTREQEIRNLFSFLPVREFRCNDKTNLVPRVSLSPAPLRYNNTKESFPFRLGCARLVMSRPLTGIVLTNQPISHSINQSINQSIFIELIGWRWVVTENLMNLWLSINIVTRVWLITVNTILVNCENTLRYVMICLHTGGQRRSGIYNFSILILFPFVLGPER